MQYLIYVEFDYYCQGMEKGWEKVLVNASSYEAAKVKIANNLHRITTLPCPEKARNFKNLTL